MRVIVSALQYLDSQLIILWPNVDMESLLTPVSTSYNAPTKGIGDALVEVSPAPAARKKPTYQASTPAEALEILRNEPDYEELLTTLHFIKQSGRDFDITSPSPLAAQLVHTIASDTVPTYWHVLQSSTSGTKVGSRNGNRSSSGLKLLLYCLRSVTGLNAVLLSLKQQIQKSKDPKKAVGGPKIEDILLIYLQLLQALLRGEDTVSVIWNSVCNTSDNPSRQKAIWNEFLGLVGGSKILGIAAEAEDVINGHITKIGDRHWVADGILYSQWISQNIVHWAKAISAESIIGWKDCAELLSKSFRLGHTGMHIPASTMNSLLISIENIVKDIVTSLLIEKEEYQPQFLKLMESLPSFEQRNVLSSILKIVSRDHLSFPITTEAKSQWWKFDASTVAAVSGLINLFVAGDQFRKDLLLSWLTSSSGAGAGDGIAIRRAVLATLAGDNSDMETILDKSLNQFGDQLYIRHTPTLQQEGTVLYYPYFKTG